MAATGLEGNPAPRVRRRRLMLLPIALPGVIGLALAYLFLAPGGV
ncbi:hypothetical protein [Arthrobacter sp. UYEF36]